MKRDEPGRLADEGVLHLKVAANPQSSGGVLIKVRGNDREDVRKHQAEWSEWAKSLPKKDPGPSASEAETQELTPARASGDDASVTEHAGDAPSSDAGERGEVPENKGPDRILHEGSLGGTRRGLD